MAHNKDRSRVNVADVDWEDPRLEGLLDKTEGLSIDQRSGDPPVKVSIHVAGGWESSAGNKPALLVANIDGTHVLETHFPLPRGGQIHVTGIPGNDPDGNWEVVTDEREGVRAGDKDKGIYVNWLRPH